MPSDPWLLASLDLDQLILQLPRVSSLQKVARGTAHPAHLSIMYPKLCPLAFLKMETLWESEGKGGDALPWAEGLSDQQAVSLSIARGQELRLHQT